MRERIQLFLCLAWWMLCPQWTVLCYQAHFRRESASSSSLLKTVSEDPASNTPPDVVVVGKIIVDEYGSPDSSDPPKLTVGGGGPQAAMGAALALAALDHRQGRCNTDPPPPQRVFMMGAIGDLDFGEKEESQVREVLKDALQEPPLLLRGNDCVTPRIRLWHEGEDQVLKWYAIDDSFGDEKGAGKLWKTVPSVEDYQRLLKKATGSVKPILHIICEAGSRAPGRNGDSKPLLDPVVRNSISCLGIEPILFPQDEGVVSSEDGAHCLGLLRKILNEGSGDSLDGQERVSVIISPDSAAYSAINKKMEAMTSFDFESCFGLDSWAVREGPKGSTIVEPSGAKTSVPAATLRNFVNPTGAGNAYSAAYTALRGRGCDFVTSSTIATGVGAVFCEYEHCPPYSTEIVERILHASKEVKKRLAECAS